MMTPEQMAHCLHTTGLSVLFARVVHPAMKYAAPVRTALKFRTIFNFPDRSPTRQFLISALIGISDQQYLEIYASCLQQLGVKKPDRTWYRWNGRNYPLRTDSGN